MWKTAILALALGLATAGTAEAQTWVNGKRLTADEMTALARYSCGPVWPGRYWLNMATGHWGFEGNPIPMGHIRDRCAGTQRPGLSQRGMLYRPGEILNGQ
ncbi:MAG: hypothetical protein AAFV86_13610 [Pseudomonadota bacterium]